MTLEHTAPRQLVGGPLDGHHEDLSQLCRVTEFAVPCRCDGPMCFDGAQYDRDGRWVVTRSQHSTRGGDPVGRRRDYLPGGAHEHRPA